MKTDCSSPCPGGVLLSLTHGMFSPLQRHRGISAAGGSRLQFLREIKPLCVRAHGKVHGSTAFSQATGRWMEGMWKKAAPPAGEDLPAQC